MNQYPANQNSANSYQANSQRRTPRHSAGTWTFDLLVVAMILTLIMVFFYQPVRVEGTSMLPLLEDQDRLTINKFVYKVGDIRRSDVVVFRYPRDTTKSYIKRIIGLPGDDIRIDHGQLYLNGTALRESYVPLKYEDDRSEAEMVVPPNQYFVMGDHRSISSDSRDFGPVDRKLIYGRAAFIYWPVDQAGVVK